MDNNFGRQTNLQQQLSSTLDLLRSHAYTAEEIQQLLTRLYMSTQLAWPKELQWVSEEEMNPDLEKAISLYGYETSECDIFSFVHGYMVALKYNVTFEETKKIILNQAHNWLREEVKRRIYGESSR